MLLLLDILTTAAILFVVAVGLAGDLRRAEDHQFRPWRVADDRRLLRRGRRRSSGSTRGRRCRSPSSSGALLGGVAELFIIRPLYRRPLDAILATWGLGIVIGQLITLAFGRDVQLIPNLMSGTVRVLVGRLFGLSPVHALRRACDRPALCADDRRHAARPLGPRGDHERDAGALRSASTPTGCGSRPS